MSAPTLLKPMRPRTRVELMDYAVPVAVYLYARRKWTAAQLIARSGLSPRHFHRIAKRRTWASTPLEKIDAFCAACEVDHFHLKKYRKALLQMLRAKRPHRVLTVKLAQRVLASGSGQGKGN